MEEDSVSKPVSELVGNVHDKDNNFKANDVEDMLDKENVEVNKKKEKTSTFDCWKFFTKRGHGEDGKDMA